MKDHVDGNKHRIVALLRGGAWIEMFELGQQYQELAVALLRGGAWIEIP